MKQNHFYEHGSGTSSGSDAQHNFILYHGDATSADPAGSGGTSRYNTRSYAAGTGGDGNGSGGGNGGDEGNGSGGSGKKAQRPVKIIQMTRRSLILTFVLILVLAVALSFGGTMLANHLNGTNSSSGTSTNVTGTGYKLQNATKSKLSVQEINTKVKDSVVEITTESSQQGGWIGEYVTEGAGSGVIIKSNGYIMTNNHVIDGASNIKVTVGKKNYSAKVVGTDEDNDVAVLKINAKNLSAVTYGNSSQLSVGDMAVVIGNPLGTLGGSVSAGVISATNRNVTINNQSMTLIQTDASVNPGNSGGGMFNDSGQLVGLVVAKSSGEDVEGLGFAIPVNVAAKSASDIMKGKSTTSSKANTGMAYTELSKSQARQQNREAGVYIAQVNSSEAQQAGFRTWDRVYSVAGKKITSFSKLKRVIQSKKAGDKVKFVVIRSNRKVTLTLKLISESDAESSTNSNSGSSANSGGSGGSSGDYYYGNGNGSSDSNGSGNSGSDLFDFFNNF